MFERNLSFALIACAAVAFMWLERWKPYNRGQILFRTGFWTDMIWYNFAQSYVLGLTIAALITWIDQTAGSARFRLVSDWPVAAQVGFFVITHDFYIYCFHRLQHAIPWLWRTHEAHHATNDVDWLSGVRSHPLEILINQTVEFLPIILLGAAPEVAAYKGAISAIWGMYIHSNLDVRMGALQYIFNGPEMHRWHHARSDQRAWNRNFGTKLAVWDWLFGTAFFPSNEKCTSYGLTEDFPEGYLAQILFAFRGQTKKEEALHDNGMAVSGHFDRV